MTHNFRLTCFFRECILMKEKEEYLIKRLEIGEHLVIDPSVCHGQLTFKGTRIPVETVLLFLSTGRTIDWVLTEWPRLTREAVEEAIRLATAALIER